MQPRIGSDQSLNIFYQTLTLEYRSTEPCSCYNKAIDEICRRLELHRKRGILSIVALITFINGIIKACSFTFLKYGDMKIKDKITQSLASITVELQEISPDFYVIGASAMILSGIEVGETADIDILTTEMNSCKLQHLLKTYMEISPETKEDDLFRSNFARFKLPLMDIEVMGDLQIKKNDIWQSVCVKEYKEIFIGNLIIKIPTIEEQKRILSLFGREKDLKRILILNHYLL